MIQQRIKTVREARGLGQQELADATGTSLRAVQKWEAGESKPRPKAVRSLASALGVTTEYLTGFADDPDSTTPTREAIA